MEQQRRSRPRWAAIGANRIGRARIPAAATSAAAAIAPKRAAAGLFLSALTLGGVMHQRPAAPQTRHHVGADPGR